LYYLGNTLLIDPYLAWLQQHQPSASGSTDQCHRQHEPQHQHPLDVHLEHAARVILEYFQQESLASIKNSLGLDLLRYEEEAMVAAQQEEAPDSDDSDASSTSASPDDESEDDDANYSTTSCEQDGNEDNNRNEKDRTKNDDDVNGEAILSQDLRNLTLEPSGEEETATLQEQSQKSSTQSYPPWIQEVLEEHEVEEA